MPSHQRILLLWQTQCYSRPSCGTYQLVGSLALHGVATLACPLFQAFGSLPPPSALRDQEILTSVSQTHGAPAPSPGSHARMSNAISKESVSLLIHFPYPISHFISLCAAPSPSTPTHNPRLPWGHVGWVPQLLRAIFPFLYQQDHTFPGPVML